MKDKFALLLHDWQWAGVLARMLLRGWYKGFYLATYPETVPLWRTPKGGKEDIELSAAWLEYVAAINSPAAFKFIMSPPAGWLNRNRRADTLGFGGNIVSVVNVKNKSAEIEALDFRQPPNPKKINHEITPWLVHKMYAVTKGGKTVLPGNDLEVYVPIIKKTKLYVAMKRIRFF